MTQNKQIKIGVFGGTFDPIHLGHVQCAQIAAEQLSLDKVIFVPAGTPNFKDGDKLASKNDRLAMVKLATAQYDNFTVSEVELNRPGTSFTSDTINQLAKYNPECQLYFITGSDAALTFERWHNYQQIVDKCTLVAVMRKGSTLTAQQTQHIYDVCQGNVEFIEADALDISSHEIRQMIAEKKDTSKYLNLKVAEYIATQKCY